MPYRPSALDWIAPPRAYMVALFTVVYTVVLSLIVVALAFLTRSQNVLNPIIRYIWPLPMLWLGGVRVDVRGTEHVRRKGKGFILLFNHSSMADIPVLYGYFPRPFRFGAKVELFS